MLQRSIKSRLFYQQTINRATVVSVAVNTGLTILKLTLGFFTQSIALISDGIDSLTDLIKDAVVWVGAKLGNKPADKDHHFGHGKFETFAELILALLILASAASIFWYALGNVHAHKDTPFHVAVMAAAVISLSVKEMLFRWTRKLARSIGSQVLLANAWHHRSDALSSLVVLLGAGFTFYGFPYADSLAAIVIGAFIAYTGFKFLRRGLMELSESTPGKELEKKVREILIKIPDVKSFHNLRLRKQGSQLLMDMHIMVDPALTIGQAHDVSTKVEYQIKNSLGYDTTNVLVHVEPLDEDHTDL